MSLTLYNSLTRQKELFLPLDGNRVGMYVCGPTVYNRAHLGNARPVVIFDVLYRLLSRLYPNVIYVRNITDVDDKINAASHQQGISIGELTTQTIAAFHQDMAALKTLPPTYEPLATAHIDSMIKMIQTLLKKGVAYEAQGHVLFEVAQYSAYGHLSRRNQEELVAGARVEVAPYKKSPADFVLWKPSTSDQPGWKSPWGRGRPGWHIECSAMSTDYLGETFDIHAGGIDLIFPHHENEMAQSCCAYGAKTMANYWLHNGHLTVSGDKMSKSLGNFFTVHDLLQTYNGETIRLALLMTHYRQPLDWREDVLAQAKQTLDRWYGALGQVDQEALKDNQVSDRDESVLKALQDDLNTPQAIAALHPLANQFYKTADPKQHLRLAKSLKETTHLLGLLQDDPQGWQQSNHNLLITAEEIEVFIQQRHQARLERNFAKADAIRKELGDKGIQLEDKAARTLWSRI